MHSYKIAAFNIYKWKMRAYDRMISEYFAAVCYNAVVFYIYSFCVFIYSKIFRKLV